MFYKKNVYSYGLVGILFLIALVSVFVVTSNDITITPSNPIVGSVVTISGKTTPNTAITAQVSFEKVIPVSKSGTYQYVLRKIVIPSGKNSLTVKTTRVQSMNVGLKRAIWTTVTAKVVNGVSSVSRSNVAAGTYDAIIYGNSKESSVVISVTATKVLTADSKGNYVFLYNTSGMPTGVYNLRIGKVTKTFTLK